MKQRIKRAKISHVSLVPRGKNKLPTIYKEDTGEVEFDCLTKEMPSFTERGELLAVVYAPDHADTDGHQASAEVIKEIMYGYARDGGHIDVRHNGVALKKEQAYIAEQFLVQKGDPRFADYKDRDGKAVDVTGGWAQLIKIDDPGLRQKYSSGEWGGVSMFGTGELVPETSGVTKMDVFMDAFNKALNTKHPQQGKDEIDMDAKELAALLAESNKTLAKEIVTALTPKTETKTDAKKDDADAAPIFKGDFTNPREVKAHAASLRAWQLKKSVDWSDPKSVDNYLQTLEKGAETKTDDKSDDKGETKTDGGEQSPELVKALKDKEALEAQIAKMQSSSNQSKGGKTDAKKDDTAGWDTTHMSKEDIDIIKAGKEMGRLINAERGIKA